MVPNWVCPPRTGTRKRKQRNHRTPNVFNESDNHDQPRVRIRSDILKRLEGCSWRSVLIVISLAEDHHSEANKHGTRGPQRRTSEKQWFGQPRAIPVRR